MDYNVLKRRNQKKSLFHGIMFPHVCENPYICLDKRIFNYQF